MMRANSIYFKSGLMPFLVLLVLLLHTSCVSDPPGLEFDSEILPVTNTKYISGLEMPGWIQNQVVLDIDLTPNYNMDSVLSDLSALRRIGTKCILLRNIQSSEIDDILNIGTRKVLKDFYEPDSLIGTNPRIKDVIFSAHQKGIKVLGEFNSSWVYESALNNSDLEITNWDDLHYKIDDSQENNALIQKAALKYINDYGFDGLFLAHTEERDIRVWDDLRNQLGKDEEAVLIGDGADLKSLDETFNAIGISEVNWGETNIDYVQLRSIISTTSDTLDFLINAGPVLMTWPLNRTEEYQDAFNELKALIQLKNFMNEVSEIGDESSMFRKPNGLLEIERKGKEMGYIAVFNETDSILEYNRLNEYLYKRLLF